MVRARTFAAKSYIDRNLGRAYDGEVVSTKRLVSAASTLAGIVLSTASACAPEAPRLELRTGDATSPVDIPTQPARVDVPFTIAARGTGEVVTTGAGFTLLATVASPIVDGVEVQATDVQWVGDRVVASYNNRGERAAGAIQIIDAHDPAAPVVVAEAAYPATDVNRLVLAGNRILAVAADQQLGATFERFTLDGDQVTYDDYATLPGYAGTYLSLDGNRAFTAFGDVGGVAIWDVADGTPTLLRTVPVDDARWAAEVDDEDLLVVAGSPGRVSRHADVLASPAGAVDTVMFDGGDVGAPTWATRSGELMFLSADAGGIVIYDVATMTPLGTLATAGTANGTALTADRRLLFAANGEEGLVVADVTDPAAPTALASIDVADDAGSANAVALHGDVIALADGLGGVKLIRYERDQAAPSGDCDGDGQLNAFDDDDDDDGTLDEDDAAPCDPDRVCAEGMLEYEGAFVGDFYNLPCDHPDVEGPITGVRPGHLPGEYDWWSDPYYVFTIERDTLFISYAQNYFPVDTGLCGDPFYFAAHWYTTAVASEAGDYRFSMGSDDDGWLMIDDRVVIDLGGIHAADHRTGTIHLSAGPHRVDVWFAERHRVQSALELEIIGLPSPEARLEPIQRICLDPDGDEDGDGVPNRDDVAPLTRPGN